MLRKLLLQLQGVFAAAESKEADLAMTAQLELPHEWLAMNLIPERHVKEAILANVKVMQAI